MATSPAASGRGETTIGFRLLVGALGELGDFRKSLGADLGPEEFREAIAQRAADGGLPLVAALIRLREDQGEGAEYLREWLHKLVDNICDKHEDLTFGEAVRRLDEKARLTELGLQFVNQMAEEGTSKTVPDLLDGHLGIVNIPLGNGWKCPVLVAVATPFTNRGKWLRRVSFAFQWKFAPMAQMRPESLMEAARSLPGWMAGKESRDIADGLFEQEGAYSKIKAENETKRLSLYKRAVAERALRLRKRKQQYIQAVKKVMGPNSRE